MFDVTILSQIGLGDTVVHTLTSMERPVVVLSRGIDISHWLHWIAMVRYYDVISTVWTLDRPCTICNQLDDVTRSLAPDGWLVLMFSCVGGILTQGMHREDVGARGAGVWDRYARRGPTSWRVVIRSVFK